MMGEREFTVELEDDDIERIEELTGIIVDTPEDLKAAIYMLLYELS